MARHLLVIPLGVDFADARTARQPVQTMAFEDAVDGCIRHADSVIARHVPHDPFGSEVILATQMKDLLLNLRRRLVGR